MGYEELGNALVDIGLAVGIIGFIWATIFYALSSFFNELSDDKSKNKENTNFRLIEVLRIRILSIIRQFFQRISC